MNMQPKLLGQTLDAIEASGTALKQADTIVLAIAAEKRAADALIPGLIDKMAEAQLIEDHDRPHALAKLATHDGAVEIIGRLLTKMAADKAAMANQLRAAGQGAPVTEKSAGAVPVTRNPPYVGARTGLGEERASDSAFAEAMLGRN